MKTITFSLLFIFLIVSGLAQTGTLNRPNDPIVLTGAELPSFSAMKPARIVGFRFSQGTWAQIPVQADERALLDIVTPYGPLASGAGHTPSASNPKILFYCDTATYVGTDPDTTFDSNDELVFMAKDAGDRSDGSAPAGVISASCLEVTITDPLGGAGYVYLFRNAGSMRQDAGMSYVNYSSDLLSTPGFPANLNTTNAENTSITTAHYSWHFSAEWVCDQLKIVTGTNTDILDRYKNFFANGNCGRHEDTFSAGENAFIAVKAGPIRIIRSYMGANSGPLTQRTHLFYEGRQDIFTDLRVHHIASIYDVFDYNSSAGGMIYRNNLNTSGVTIDGVQDALTNGDISWEQITGVQGTISMILRRTTDLTAGEATFNSYYDDNSTNPASNCTGDGQAWGTSGGGTVFVNSSVCTDPMGSGCAGTQWLRNLQYRRVLYTDSGNRANNTAEEYNNRFNHPMVISVTSCHTDTTYTVTTISDPSAGGTTSGSGSYISGTNVIVHASAYYNYLFTNWTENGNMVSTDSTFSFTIRSDRNLTANFIYTSGINESSADQEISVFPNPGSGLIQIGTKGKYKLIIYNSSGQEIWTADLEQGNSSVTIEGKGIFLLQFIGKGNTGICRKVVLSEK